MEKRNYLRNEPTLKDIGKNEQQSHAEYTWVSYPDEEHKKSEEESDNSILERSNRFAL